MKKSTVLDNVIVDAFINIEGIEYVYLHNTDVPNMDMIRFSRKSIKKLATYLLKINAEKTTTNKRKKK